MVGLSQDRINTHTNDFKKEKGMNVTAVGKIEDIFEHRGMTRTDHTTNNNDGIEKTIQYAKEEFEGILFTNLVDTDMIYQAYTETVCWYKKVFFETSV